MEIDSDECTNVKLKILETIINKIRSTMFRPRPRQNRCMHHTDTNDDVYIQYKFDLLTCKSLKAKYIHT